MFYCDTCAAKHGWPETAFIRSLGACEICDRAAACNDVPSVYLASLRKSKKEVLSGTD